MLRARIAALPDASYLLGFNIYLHDKGQFWPGLEMGRVGLSYAKFLPVDKEWEGSFEVRQKTLLDKENIPCSKDPRFSFQGCVLAWVGRQAGCNLDWFSPSPLASLPTCTELEDITNYQEALNMALLARWLQLSEMTGCVPRCAVRSFSLVEKSMESATWARNWSSSFYLDVKTSSFIHQSEFFAFDEGELASGLGGFMGIFLGWSFLSVLGKVYEGLEGMLARLTQGKSKVGSPPEARAKRAAAF